MSLILDYIHFEEKKGMNPADVHKTISQNILADGYSIIFDMERSHDTYFVDEISGREYLDFFTFFASNAVGYNHPKLKDPSFLEKLTLSAIHKPSNSDIYTTLMAEFVDKFSLPWSGFKSDPF
jgi:L-lysine 6-transaminase